MPVMAEYRHCRAKYPAPARAVSLYVYPASAVLNQRNMQPEKFSIRSRIRSFSYALAGLRQFVMREHNARVHLAATIGVIIVALVVQVTRTEAAILAIVTGLVWVAEILNTC